MADSVMDACMPVVVAVLAALSRVSSVVPTTAHLSCCHAGAGF